MITIRAFDVSQCDPVDNVPHIIHKSDEASYKHRFSIHYTVGIVSAPTAKRHAEAYAKSISPEERLAYVVSGLVSLKQKVEAGNYDQRELVSSVYDQKVQQIKTVNDAPSCVTFCFLCGNSVSVNASRVFFKAEMIRCEQCIAPQSRRPYRMRHEDREKLRQWAEDNPERAREYLKARSWWSWHRNPFPLIAYANKWGARVRIMPELLKAAHMKRTSKL
jgi:hypothetical protein